MGGQICRSHNTIFVILDLFKGPVWPEESLATTVKGLDSRHSEPWREQESTFGNARGIVLVIKHFYETKTVREETGVTRASSLGTRNSSKLLCIEGSVELQMPTCTREQSGTAKVNGKQPSG